MISSNLHRIEKEVIPPYIIIFLPKPDKYNIGNYRPISLMNIVTKTLNKPNSAIYKKIYHVKAEFSLKCKVGLTLESLLF